VKVFIVSRCSWTFFNFRRGLATALAARKTDVTGGGAGGDGYEEKISALGIPYKVLPVDKRGVNPIADMRLIATLYRWYRQGRPDVVHHFTIKPVIYGSIAARLAGVPRIVNTITGLGYVYTGRQGPLRWIVDLLYRIALRCSHVVFFQNDDDRTLFLRNGLVRAEVASLMREGVDIQRFHPAVVAASNGSEGAVAVLMLSRVLRDKGVYEYVDAARILKKAMPNVRCSILGEIDMRNPSAVPEEAVNAWHEEGVVRWFRHTDEVRPYIAMADIVVLPSYREGMPRSLLEASAMGKAVIATDVVGCREVVEHGRTGLLVPVRDAEALAKAIIELARDPERRARMGAAGREKVLKQFDERIAIESAIKAYGEPA
jgi:glycosyltransferase involved in cell wall biosynthesis